MTERLHFEDEIRKNKIKSALLVFGIIVFFILLGYIIGIILGPDYFFLVMIISIIFSLGYTLYSYYNSDRIALASVRARLASRTEHRALIDAVESMALASGLPPPKVYVMNSREINAFASGRDPQHSVICFTTGALEKLNKQELEGVVAHEMSHIANFDIRFMTLTTVLVGMISILAEIFLRSLWFSSNDNDNRGKNGGILILVGILLSILAPLAARLVALAVSRRREYNADATGVKFTRSPTGLKHALIKIKEEHVDEREKHKYPKAMAPLFISDPWKRKITGLFATHPPLEMRIKKLETM